MKSPLNPKHAFVSKKVLRELIPPKSIIDSYCLYSGDVELSLAAADRLVVAHTNKYPVYEFWHAAKKFPQRVAGLAESTAPRIDDTLFYKLQEEWWTYGDPIYRSALFFILNQGTSTGTTSCGKREYRHLDPVIISRLREFKGENFYVLLDQHDDVCDNITDEVKSDVKLFLPGKYGLNLLSHNRERAQDYAPINHLRLFRALEGLDKKWIIVYKFNKGALKRYKNYNIIMIDEYGNKTQKPERCEDLVIANH